MRHSDITVTGLCLPDLHAGMPQASSAFGCRLVVSADERVDEVLDAVQAVRLLCYTGTEGLGHSFSLHFSLLPHPSQGWRILTLTKAYRQMDIQLVSSFSTTVSVLKENPRLVKTMSDTLHGEALEQGGWMIRIRTCFLGKAHLRNIIGSGKRD